VSAALLLATYNGQIPFAVYAQKSRKSEKPFNKSCVKKLQLSATKGQQKKKCRKTGRQAVRPSGQAKKKRNLHMKMAHKRGQKGGGGEWPRDKNEDKA